ncbi:MAG: hypothetical protein IKZ59_05805 [Clostridia bacterium]|nr:hypothetical protein [Clostridia bacterium]
MSFKVRYKPLHHIQKPCKKVFILLRQLFERGKRGLGVAFGYIAFAVKRGGNVGAVFLTLK